jgi:hypothetical protein
MPVGVVRKEAAMNWWLAGAAGWLLYRRGQRKAEAESARGVHTWAGTDGLRPVTLADGSTGVQLDARYFEPDPDHPEEWRAADVLGTEQHQRELAATLRLHEPGPDGPADVPALLVPHGARWNVNAVDVVVTGGVVGTLPPWAVSRIGASLRATESTSGMRCAVPSRVLERPDGLLHLEVLLPVVFEPGR